MQSTGVGLATIRLNFWRVVALLVLCAGAWATWLRFTKGFAAMTNLSDQFPWGLWVGFDVLCGVGLAAGGFAITGAVYILHLEKYRPIVRPTVLTAFLGYLLVTAALMFDLGRPWAIWHAIIMWNPHSVMFEVAWCVMLYTTVLTLEFSPIIFERFGLHRAQRAVKAAVVPLVGLGFLLSTLHQSSLGTLYLILPTKLHPLWYSPWLPVLFWVSAIAVGLAMVIFESGLSARAFGLKFEFGLLQSISRGMGAFMIAFLTLRFVDLIWRGSIHHAFVATGPGSYEAGMFWLEILFFAAALVGLFVPDVRDNPRGLWGCAVMVVSGFVLNRLNVSITGLEASSGVRYYPSWAEAAITASIVVVGLILFTLAAKHLPVLHGKEAHSEANS